VPGGCPINFLGPALDLVPFNTNGPVSCVQRARYACELKDTDSGNALGPYLAGRIDEIHVDIIMLWFVFQDDPLDEAIVEYLGDFHKENKKPILVGANGGPYTQRMSALIESHDVPVYDDIRTWVAAASALTQWGETLACRQKDLDNPDHIVIEANSS